MNRSAKLTPDWHAQAAAELNRDFAETEALSLNAQKRRVYLGLKFLYVKFRGKEDGSIPHGQFQAWLQENCPQIPRRSVGNYTTEARSVCERMGWQIGQIGHFEIPPHRLLEAPQSELPPKQQKSQQLLFDLLDGKGKFAPVTEWKRVSDGDDLGDEAVVRGREPGEGGRAARPRTDAAEQIAFDSKYATRHCGLALKELAKVGPKACLLDDEMLSELLKQLGRVIAMGTAWLSKPRSQRDPAEIEAIWTKGKA